MLLDGILAISSILFIIIFLVCYRKLKTKKEEFGKFFHIEKPKSGESYSYNPDHIILSKDTNNIDKNKYINELTLNTLHVTDKTKLYIGDSVNDSTNIGTWIMYVMKNDWDRELHLPYIYTTTSGEERLTFGRYSDGELTPDNLRVLKGQKLAPIFNKYGHNDYALKIDANLKEFDKTALKCGYLPISTLEKGNITGTINIKHKY